MHDIECGLKCCIPGCRGRCCFASVHGDQGNHLCEKHYDLKREEVDKVVKAHPPCVPGRNLETLQRWSL